MNLSLQNLIVRLISGGTVFKVVDQLNLDLPAGHTLGIVGESGCGKSMTALSLMRLVARPPLHSTEGKALWGNTDLLALDNQQMRRVRGNEISMIFQEPMTALNPVLSVEAQLREVLMAHRSLSRSEARELIVQMLRQVGIPSPEKRLDVYPHQLSGGMRQRVMIAMALICDPQLLIADEPTTALDVTIQAQILELLISLKEQRQMSLLFISHDLDSVAYLADTIAVMYAGQVVELASVEALIHDPKHPYTQALFKARPRKSQTSELTSIPGSVPDLKYPPSGCRFFSRCPQAKKICQEPVELRVCSSGQQVRCVLY